MAAAKPSCPVCCDAYTKDKRRPIACPGCAYAACASCVRQYLLASQADPGCMNCGLYWNRAFLDGSLTAAWRNGQLRRHRAEVLLDRERALLPAAQPLVEAEMRRRARVQRHREALERLQEARKTLAAVRSEYYQSLYHRDNDGDGEPAAKDERRQFVAACPDSDCRGFLSTQYRCGTCLKRFCAHCREAKPDDAEHACDPATVETISLIRRECRPCPNCGMAISRVSGCDHMFCTACDTGFSYATGSRIENRHNTNPHMYERMRQLQERGGATDAAASEPPGAACGAQLVWPSLRYMSRDDVYGDWETFLFSMHQCGRHVQEVVLRDLRTGRRNADTTPYRVKYCLKDIDDRRFSALLQQHEKRRELNLELVQALDVFVLMAFEFFAELRDLPTEELRRSCAERCRAFAASVEELVNAPLQELARRYDRPMPRVETCVSVHPRNTRSRAVDIYLPSGHTPKKRSSVKRRVASSASDDEEP
jgi:hypothetical protein